MFARHYIVIVEAFISCSIDDTQTLTELTSRIVQLSAQLIADETLVTIVMVEERGLERLLLALRLMLMRSVGMCQLNLWTWNVAAGGAGGDARRPDDRPLVRPSESDAGGRWPVAVFLPFGVQCIVFSNMFYYLLQQRLVSLCFLNQERLITMFIEVLALFQGTYSYEYIVF